MNCRMGDLHSKEVINTRDGAKLGSICDIELDTKTARLVSVVIYGRLRLFGLLGRRPDIVIPWEKITLIGDDTVLVNCDLPETGEKQTALANFFDKIGF